MQDLIDFLATKEVMIVLIILGIILTVYLILFFIELSKRHEKKKNLKNNTMELNRLVEEVKQQLEKEKQQTSSTPAVTTKEATVESLAPTPVETLLQEEIVMPKAELPTALKETDVFEAPPVTPVLKEETPSIVIEKGFTSPIAVQPMVVEVPTAAPVTNNTQELLIGDEQHAYMADVEILDMEPEKTEAPVVVKEAIEETPTQEQILYKDEVYTKTEAQQELERLTEELRKAEQEDKIGLTEFEVAQEENAIISLEELLEKGASLTVQNEQTQYQDEGNEPISIEELERRYQASKQEEVVEEIPLQTTEEPPKSVALYDLKTAPATTNENGYQTVKPYKPTPVISPIYGIEEEPLPTAIALENTANYEKLDEEIRKTNEFLSKLKEFQKKLD